MGDGFVVPDSADGSWRLAAPHKALTQGLIVSPFAHLPEACALFLELSSDAGAACGGAWLGKLRAACAITDATGAASPSAALAFTASGLRTMGLDDDVMATFSPAFTEGMHQIDRQRRLSDVAGSDTVIEGGPIWSGNTGDPWAAPGDVVATEFTVHAALLLYAADADGLGEMVRRTEAALDGTVARIGYRLALSLRFDAKQRGREHFGFADGLSQPVPQGEAIVSKAGGRLADDPVNGIAAGDILMGHCNAQGELAPGPIVRTTPGRTDDLMTDGAPEGFCNLGLDGSYLVLRELRQDVAAFWNSMHDAMGDASTPDQAIWLASRVVGRTMDGDMLVPGGALAAAADGPRNDFRFFETDPHGFGCPIGSHVRRANPRDGLASDAASAPGLLQASRNHRILRRGRKIGPTIVDPRKDDGVIRGLLFMCLNTDLVRQFEFVQQTWMLNSNFGGLLDESDPLLGPAGRFTIPTQPLRWRPAVQTFVRFAGGEYFFLPSLPALDYLQRLPAGGRP